MRITSVLAVLLLVGCVAPVERIRRPAANPDAPYSASVTVGSWTFVAGQIGDANVDFRAEAESALRNVHRELRRAGLEPEHAVDVTVYLTAMADYDAFNDVYARFFPSRPARACVAVAALPRGAKVEVRVVAHAP